MRNKNFKESDLNLFNFPFVNEQQFFNNYNTVTNHIKTNMLQN
jgi:hypothetical protein